MLVVLDVPTVYSAVTEPLASHTPLQSVGLMVHWRGRVLLFGTQGITRDVTGSKPHAPAPRAPGTALHCRSRHSRAMPGVGSSWFRPMPPSPLPLGLLLARRKALLMARAGRPLGSHVPSSGVGGISSVRRSLAPLQSAFLIKMYFFCSWVPYLHAPGSRSVGDVPGITRSCWGAQPSPERDAVGRWMTLRQVQAGRQGGEADPHCDCCWVLTWQQRPALGAR